MIKFSVICHYIHKIIRVELTQTIEAPYPNVRDRRHLPHSAISGKHKTRREDALVQHTRAE